jgi:hypothetical protein
LINTDIREPGIAFPAASRTEPEIAPKRTSRISNEPESGLRGRRNGRSEVGFRDFDAVIARRQILAVEAAIRCRLQVGSKLLLAHAQDPQFDRGQRISRMVLDHFAVEGLGWKANGSRCNNQ